MDRSLTVTVPLGNLSIANYKVVELIGSGGMANIYKAIQLSLDRPIALKIMHQHLTLEEGFVARFQKEAKQAAQLQHENIVSIIDYGCEQGVYYIAMEYVDGKNLKEILEKQKRLPLEICLLICHQVAEGLKYAHSHNLIHRDIKPSNIILSNDGRVMLTDFGIAKGCDDLTITATGQMIGSPAYMSPEQAAGKPIDHRSDIFSLGIIGYEMIAGQKPFIGETYQEMVASIMSKVPESLQKLRIDVNSEIEDQVKKALVKDVYSRYQNVEEFADRIYAELQRYKIPPVKKLISSFLNNPIKVTAKLRTDKISGHMESALYYVTMGEGRLKEAQKEFQEVLRYDKNNKTAKEYLKKLESHADRSKVPAISKKFMKFKKWYVFSGLGLLIAVIAILMLKMATGVNFAGETLQSLVKSIAGPQDTLAVSGNAAAPAGFDSNSEKSAGEKQSKNPANTNIKSSGAKERNSASKKRSSDNGSPQTSARIADFNYPYQNLKEFGFLKVKTNAPARIFIDKIEYGNSNGPPVKLSPGRHFVEIKADGYRRMTRRIFTEKDKQEDMEVNLIAE